MNLKLNASYIMNIVGLYYIEEHLLQVKRFYIAAVTCEAVSSLKNTNFLDLNFKFLLPENGSDPLS